MIQIIKKFNDIGQYQWGVTDEIGINIRSMQIRFYPEVNERFKDSGGNTVVRSVSAYFSREITCVGEVSAGNGIMAFTLGAACAFSNTHQFAFAPYGGSFLLDDATITLDRRGWRTVTIRASSSPFL